MEAAAAEDTGVFGSEVCWGPPFLLGGSCQKGDPSWNWGIGTCTAVPGVYVVALSINPKGFSDVDSRKLHRWGQWQWKLQGVSAKSVGVCGCLMRTIRVLLLSFSPAGWSSAEAAGTAGFISEMFSLIMFGASGQFVLFVSIPVSIVYHPPVLSACLVMLTSC